MIALISQYYEDVMNSKVQHTYEMKQELNHEYKTFVQFRVLVGWQTDKRIDSIILVDGEQEEEDGEWKGLTQTMKKMIYNKLDETMKALDRKIEKLNDDTKQEITN